MKYLNVTVNNMDTNVEYILEGNLVYELIDSFVVNDKKYLFLIGESEHDLALVYEKDNVLKEIEDDNEFDNVFDLLYERNIEKIEKLLEN